MDVALTLAEACEILRPEISERALRDIIRALAIQPTGRRWTGDVGRPESTYLAADLMRLHEAITPWLPAAGDARELAWLNVPDTSRPDTSPEPGKSGRFASRQAVMTYGDSMSTSLLAVAVPVFPRF